MRALTIHAAKDLRLDEVAVDGPGAGQVLIKTATGGICGSDLHYYNNGGFGAVRLKEPMILGHEVSGYVEVLGEGVTNLAIGDLVAVSPSRPCETCAYCQQGLCNHCENMRFLWLGHALSPYPRRISRRIGGQCQPMYQSRWIDPGEAAMAEPLAVCLHATRRVGELSGKRVLVTGSGPIGTLCVLAAKAAGAIEVVVTDLVDPALEFARQVGADQLINMSTNADALSKYQAGKGYLTFFRMLWRCAALTTGIAAMRPQGIVMQLGLGGDMSIPMQMLTAKELDLRGSFRFHEEFEAAVKLMQSGKIDVKPLISHTVTLVTRLKL